MGTNKIGEIEAEPSVVRGRSRGKSKTEKEEVKKPAILEAAPLNKGGRGGNKIEDSLPTDVEQINAGAPGRGRRAKRADVIVKPCGDTKLETQNITAEKNEVPAAKNDDKIEKNNVCEEKPILLTSKNLR